MKLTQFFLACLSILVFTSCSEKDDKPKRDLTDKETIMYTRWCDAEVMHSSWALINRLSFSFDEIRQDYISLENSSAPIFYKRNRVLSWTQSKPVTFGPVQVVLVKEPYEIQKLLGFSSQKNVLEKSLSTNPWLKNSSFNPSMAITLKSTDPKNDESFYPCASYSAVFDVEGEQHSMMEFKLKIRQSLSNYTLPSLHLKFPLKEKNTNIEELRNTQWCSWFQDTKLTLLHTLTIGEKIIVENEFSDFLSRRDSSEEEIKKGIELDSKYFMDWSILNSTPKLQTKLINKRGEKSEIKGLFAKAQDFAGHDILIRLNAYDPDSLSSTGGDVYFECSDTRPLEVNEFFKKYIGRMLELEMSNLTK